MRGDQMLQSGVQALREDLRCCQIRQMPEPPANARLQRCWVTRGRKQLRNGRTEVGESGTDSLALQIPVVNALRDDRKFEVAEADLPVERVEITR